MGITLALGHLHSESVIYRDLKPENLLLDGDGHVKITDFGLSKEGIDDNMSAKTLCGTPEYLAPEILERQGHGKAVDWYSLGALIYEMLTGLPPYYTRDRDKLFKAIRAGKLTYPPYLRPVPTSLLQGLLFMKPDERLGGGPGDVEDVKSHEFFAEVDWDDVYNKKLAPPFVPNLAQAGDVKYFDKEFVNQPAVDSERPGSSETTHFDGFTYCAPK